MTSTIQFKLGSWDEMADLFSWDASSGVDLRDLIAHDINQTLERDGFIGSWTDVFNDVADTITVKISAPFGDVSRYGKAIPAFIAAARIGFAAYSQHRAEILKAKLIFYLPVGLPMLKTKSVQLLHYPPYEARTYSDYLYSPTNRRWESLLGYNDYDLAGVTLLERICDAVPLAGPGGDGTAPTSVEPYFYPYGKAMLGALLDQSSARTQPVVAYGSPAHEWLKSAFPAQVKRMPKLFSVLELRVGTGKAITPVLCANHPSEFMYFDKPLPSTNGNGEKGKPKLPSKKWAFDIMIEDLIAARWQARMAERWDADPVKTLAEAKAYWDDNHKRVEEIVAAQEEEFGFAKQSPAIRNPTKGVLPSRDDLAEGPTSPSRKPNVASESAARIISSREPRTATTRTEKKPGSVHPARQSNTL